MGQPTIHEVYGLFTRVQQRAVHPPSKYNKFRVLVRRSEKDLLIEALKLACAKLSEQSKEEISE